jgi:hypothetical protein
MKNVIAVVLVVAIIICSILIVQNISGPSAVPGAKVTPAVTTGTPLTKTVQPSGSVAVTRDPRYTQEVTVFISATPLTNKDVAVSVKMQVQNAQILEVKAMGLISMPTCSNNQFFEGDTICADIAKGTPFVAGEKLLEVKLLTAGNHKLLKIAGNSYYDGVTFRADL